MNLEKLRFALSKTTRWQRMAASGLLLCFLFIGIITHLNAELRLLHENIPKIKKQAWELRVVNQKLQSLQTRKAELQSNSLSQRINQLQASIKNAGLDKQLSQLVETDQHEYRCDFVNVEFDKLVAWLAELSQESDFRVVAAKVERSKIKGEVQATLKLQS